MTSIMATDIINKKSNKIVKKQTITFNEKDLENVEIIREEMSIKALSEVVRYALSVASKKSRPPYIAVAKERRDEPEELPEDRIKRQLDKKKEDAKLKLLVHKKAQMDLAEQLYEPLIEETPTGDVKVTWPIFERVGQRVVRGMIGKMLDDIFPHHIEDQFRNGTRAEIIKLLKKQDEKK